MSEHDEYQGLREKLREQTVWPTVYMFKFIVPRDKVDEVARIFEKNEISTKESRNGNYISVTSKVLVQSSEEIINVYKSAARIEGVISL